MCKVAAETVFEEYSTGKRQLDQDSRPMVRISDVQKGSRDMFTSIVLRAVSCSTDYEALLLISLGSLKRGQDDRSFQVKDILTKIESIANAYGERRYMEGRLSLADVLGIVNRLGDVRTNANIFSFCVCNCIFSFIVMLVQIQSIFFSGWSHSSEHYLAFTFSVHFDTSSFIRNPCLVQRHLSQQTCRKALGKPKTILNHFIKIHELWLHGS